MRVRTYLILWSTRSAPGRRGLIGTKSTATPGSWRSEETISRAWTAWPPMMSSDGATTSTRTACSAVGFRALKRRRLRRMGLVEISSRSRREARKRLDRTRRSRRIGRDPVTPRLAAVFDPSRLFAGPVDTRTPRLLLERLPGAASTILRDADRARDGRFDLLGYTDLSFG